MSGRGVELNGRKVGESLVAEEEEEEEEEEDASIRALVGGVGRVSLLRRRVRRAKRAMGGRRVRFSVKGFRCSAVQRMLELDIAYLPETTSCGRKKEYLARGLLGIRLSQKTKSKTSRSVPFIVTCYETR